MIVAISRFAVKNGKDAEVRAAFEVRPGRVEEVAGFLGMEVFQDGTSFLLLTRWCDEASFRAWHASPEHHASHGLMPAGLKLDPAMTEMIVAERIDAATSEGTEGALAQDLSPLFARLVREGSAVHVAIVDGEGIIVRANAAFARAAGGDPGGQALGGLLTTSSRDALQAHLAQGAVTPLVLQLVSSEGAAATLSVFVKRMPAGFALVGAPPWEDHRALEERLMMLNAELAVLARENARQARALEQANRDLRDSHWHLSKIAEVLPMCLSCREVNTGEDTWESVVSYLLRASTFLSHGYCKRCAAKAMAEAEEDGP